jgi:N12 class adenine-specific DNA methylase
MAYDPFYGDQGDSAAGPLLGLDALQSRGVPRAPGLSRGFGLDAVRPAPPVPSSADPIGKLYARAPGQPVTGLALTQGLAPEAAPAAPSPSLFGLSPPSDGVSGMPASTTPAQTSTPQAEEEDPHRLSKAMAEEYRIKNLGNFNAAVQGGWEQAKGLAAGALGAAGQAVSDATGGAVGEGLHQWGARTYQEKMKASEPYSEGRVTSFDQIKSPGDVGRYAASMLGNVAPSIAQTIVTGAVGAALGSAEPVGGTILGAITGAASKGAIAKYLEKKIGTEMISRNIGEQAARKIVGRDVGAALGTFASGYEMGVGDIYGETLDDKGRGSAVTALLGAVPYAAVETIADMTALGRVLKGSQGASALRRYAGAMLGTGMIEGSEEVVQDSIDMAAGLDAGKEYNTHDVLVRLGNSFAGGFLPGAIMGVPGGRKTEKPRSIADHLVDRALDDGPIPGWQSPGQLRAALVDPSVGERGQAQALAAVEQRLAAKDPRMAERWREAAIEALAARRSIHEVFGEMQGAADAQSQAGQDPAAPDLAGMVGADQGQAEAPVPAAPAVPGAAPTVQPDLGIPVADPLTGAEDRSAVAGQPGAGAPSLRETGADLSEQAARVTAAAKAAREADDRARERLLLDNHIERLSAQARSEWARDAHSETAARIQEQLSALQAQRRAREPAAAPSGAESPVESIANRQLTLYRRALAGETGRGVKRVQDSEEMQGLRERFGANLGDAAPSLDEIREALGAGRGGQSAAGEIDAQARAPRAVAEEVAATAPPSIAEAGFAPAPAPLDRSGFKPTHVLDDGTRIPVVEVRPNVWRDAQGIAHSGMSATPIAGNEQTTRTSNVDGEVPIEQPPAAADGAIASDQSPGAGVPGSREPGRVDRAGIGGRGLGAADAVPAVDDARADFQPTHLTSDGTPVQATEEPGIYVDADKVEVEDAYAAPIQTATDGTTRPEAPTAPAAQADQGAKPAAASPAVQGESSLGAGDAGGDVVARRVPAPPPGKPKAFQEGWAAFHAGIEAVPPTTLETARKRGTWSRGWALAQQEAQAAPRTGENAGALESGAPESLITTTATAAGNENGQATNAPNEPLGAEGQSVRQEQQSSGGEGQGQEGLLGTKTPAPAAEAASSADPDALVEVVSVYGDTHRVKAEDLSDPGKKRLRTYTKDGKPKHGASAILHRDNIDDAQRSRAQANSADVRIIAKANQDGYVGFRTKLLLKREMRRLAVTEDQFDIHHAEGKGWWATRKADRGANGKPIARDIVKLIADPLASVEDMDAAIKTINRRMDAASRKDDFSLVDELEQIKKQLIVKRNDRLDGRRLGLPTPGKSAAQKEYDLASAMNLIGQGYKDESIPIAAKNESESAPSTEESSTVDQAMDEELDAIFGPKETLPVPDRTATQAGASAVKNAVQGLGDIAAGLNALFGSTPGKLNSGLTFDEDTYAKAKPLFIAGVSHFQQAGADIAEMVKALVRSLAKDYGLQRAAVENMRPYIKRFVADVQAGTVAIGEPTTLKTDSSKEQANDNRDVRGDGAQALEDVASEMDGGTGPDGSVRVGDSGSGTSRAGGKAESDGGRVPGTRGGRGGEKGVPAADAGAGGRGGRGGDGSGKTVSGDDARTGRDRSEVRRDAVEEEQETTALAETPAAIPAADFTITDAVRLGEGGEVQKFKDNLEAIRIVQALDAERRRATPDEQRALARYVGWGGLANAFPNPETGAFKAGWEARGKALQDRLTPEEYRTARSSTRNAHYTSQTVVEAMWQAAQRLGFQGGLMLESSAGIGNFVGLMPEAVRGETRAVAVEMDGISARIAQALYPQAAVLHAKFNEVPVPRGAFDLAIGNPPFGEESLRWQFQPGVNPYSIHNQFMLANLDALKPGGLQVMVVSRYLMDGTKNAEARAKMAEKARLLGAIRLPDMAFKENARAEVVTDILFFQRRSRADEDAIAAARSHQKRPDAKEPGLQVLWDLGQEIKAEIDAFAETGKVADPLGGEPITVNRYFQANPTMMLGSLGRSGSMRHNNDVTLRLADDADLAQELEVAIGRLPRAVMASSPDLRAAAVARFEGMAEALKIAAAGDEPGSLRFGEDGALQQVMERETPEGQEELIRRAITARSPWSPRLLMDAEGRWFESVPVLGEDGKPVKQGQRNVYTRQTYATEAEVPDSLRLGETRLERLRELVTLRDLLKRQIVLEAQDAPKRATEANRAKLVGGYDAFVAKHGLINDQKTAALVAEMPDGALVLALELGYKDGISAAAAKKVGERARPATAERAAILSQRVVFPYVPAETAKTVEDALALSLSETGRVDVERVAALLGQDRAQAHDALTGGANPLAFQDPETNRLETRDAYLSGQVRRKLEAAKAAGLSGNVKALEAVQPAAWTADQVSARVGAPWIPTDVWQDFATHLVGGQARVTFSPLTNSYSLSVQGARRELSHDEWGVTEMAAQDILSAMMNSQSIRIGYTDREGKFHLNEEQTALALLKARAIGAEFQDWVFADGARRARLVALFNDKFNTRVTRQHDGSHLTLPGKVPDAIIKLRRHQLSAIWRGITEKVILIDHAVGAGKTFEAIARAMERRRLGLSRKPMIVVPNHLVEAWAADVYRLYPGAKVLAAGKKDFEKGRRRRLFAKIATGDWDVVIVPHSSFGKLGIAPETEQRYLEAELALAQQAIKDAEEQAEEDGSAGFRKPLGVKEAERLKEKIEARLDRLKGNAARDKLLTFEQLGVDDLTVDESHEFKNLYFSTRLTNVRGMGNKAGSNKAFDLYNKVRVLHENPSGSIVFMTGTPISNSAVEMYTLMRYLAQGELRDLGLEHFDAWRAQYSEVKAQWSPNETGRLVEVNRLGPGWDNMRSLMELYYSFTDAVTFEDIKTWYREDNNGQRFPAPEVKGGDRQRIKTQPTPAQQSILDEVVAGFEGLNRIADPRERNIARLRLMDRARKVSLDARAIDPSLKTTEPGGKLAMATDHIVRLYKQWDADRGTQLVFLDRSVPKGRGDAAILKDYDAARAAEAEALASGDEEAFRRAQDRLETFDATEMEELRAAARGGWNAYQQLKDNLVAQGIPAHQIRFIQEANTDAQKKAMIDAVNLGEIRVLIGSTPRMGAGMNAQERLVGLHHLDVTWKPSDIEQREGRIIRQGNSLLKKYGETFEVEILAYVTERTIDAKMWDLNADKLRNVNGIRKYNGEFEMEFSDEEAGSMAELAALASGDPLLLERVKLGGEIEKLELLQKAHQRRAFGIEDRIETAQRDIERLPERIERLRAERAAVNAELETEQQEIAGRSVTIEGASYSRAQKMAAMNAGVGAVNAQRGEDPKARISLSIDGKRYGSEAKAVEAIEEALGDNAQFSATIDGQRQTRRVGAARVMAQLAETAADDLAPGERRTVELGETLGVRLEMEVEKDRERELTTANFRVELAAVAADGHTIDAEQSEWLSPGALKTTSMLTLVSRVRRGIEDRGGQGRLREEDRLEEAKSALPDLLAKRGTPFEQGDELKAKRARLAEVIGLLSGERTGSAEEVTTATGEMDPALAMDSEGGGQAGRFSLGAPVVGERVSAERLQGLMDAYTAKLKGLDIPVRVVQSLRQAKLTEQERATLAKARAKNPDAVPKAIFRGHEIVIIASHVTGVKDAFMQLAHEQAHFSLRKTFGPTYDGFLDELIADRNADVQVYAEARGLDMTSLEGRREAADEMLAHMAERNDPADLPFLKRVFQALRAWLRAQGFRLRLSDGDLREILAASRRYVERGDAKGALKVRERFGGKATGRNQGARLAVGDRLSSRKFLDGSPVVSLNGTEFSPDGIPLTVKVPQWYRDHHFDVVSVAGIGDVILDERAVKDSLSHGIGRDKAAAFAAVPAVLKKGRIIASEQSQRDAGMTGYFVAAPIRMGSQDYIAVALVRSDQNANRLYVHEVALKEKLQDFAFKTGALSANEGAQTGAKSGAIRSILQEIFAVNPSERDVDGQGIVFDGDGDSNPDIRFSLGTLERHLNASRNELTRRLKATGGVAETLDRGMMKGLGALTMRMLADVASRTLKAAPSMVDAMQKYQTQRNIMVDAASKVAKEMRSKPFDQVLSLTHLMNESTIEGVDASLPDAAALVPDRAEAERQITEWASQVRRLKKTIRENRANADDALRKDAARGVKEYQERIKELRGQLNRDERRAKAHKTLHARYRRLPAWAQAMYTQVRDDYIAMSKRMEQAILDRVVKSQLEAEAEVMKLVGAANLPAEQREGLEAMLIEGAYDLPRERDGKLPVTLRREVMAMVRASALNKGSQRQIETLLNQGLGTKRAMIERVRAEFEAGRVEGVYFPLQRHGSYMAVMKRQAEDGSGEETGFAMFDSEYAMNLELPDWQAEGWKPVQQGFKASELSEITGASEGFVAEVVSKLAGENEGKAADLVYQVYLDSLPYLSARKHFIHRKKTPGYAADAARSYAHNMAHLANQIARLEAQPDFANALKMMDAEVLALAVARADSGGKVTHEQEMIGEFRKRYEWIMQPGGSGLVNKINGVGFAMYLGLSPAAALVNLTQTWIVALPQLAGQHQYGYRAAARMLGRAMRESLAARRNFKTRGDYSTWAHLSPEERDAFQWWHKTGAIDVTNAHSLMGMAEQNTSQYSPKVERAMEITGFLFQEAEVINRETTLLAGYRLARARGAMPDEARAEAAEHNWKSQFDYSNANRARVMQSSGAKTLLLFKQYSLHMAWFLFRNLHQALRGETRTVRRETLKRFVGVLGMTGVFAGSQGMPWLLTTPLFLLANAAQALFGDDDDEDWDARIAWRDFLADFGLAGKVIDRGAVNALTGVDVASRVGLDKLLWQDEGRDLEGNAAYDSLLEAAAGPIGGLVKNAYLAAQRVGDGEFQRAAELLVPKAIKDPMQALRFMADGGAVNLKGEPILEQLTPWELFLKANGFTPDRLSAQSDMNSTAKRIEGRILDRRTRLLSAYGMAMLDGDADGVMAANAKIRAYNATKPAMPIDRKTLRLSLKARERYREKADSGINLNPNLQYLRDRTRVAL